MHAQKHEYQDPLPTVPADDKGLNVCLVFSEVYIQLLGFVGIDHQIIVPEPPRQLLHLAPIGGPSPENSPTMVMSSANLIM